MVTKAFPSVRNLGFQYLAAKLGQRGYLYGVFTLGGGLSHAVVIYGISFIDANDPYSDDTMYVMDPWPHPGGLRKLTREDLEEFHGAMICWLEP